MTKRKKAPATTWLVFAINGPDEPLGEVTAPSKQEAEAIAAGRWTGPVDLVPESFYASIQGRLERRVARNPWRLAYHEAGHAVVGRRWFGLGYTTIVPRAFSRAGRYDPDQDSTGTTVFFDTLPGWRYSVSTLAGPMAEFRHAGRNNWKKVIGTDRAVLDATGLGLDRLKARTRRYLDLLWPQVEIVAGALVEERHLCGDEVDYLLRDFRPPRRLSPDDDQAGLGGSLPTVKAVLDALVAAGVLDKGRRRYAQATVYTLLSAPVTATRPGT